MEFLPPHCPQVDCPGHLRRNQFLWHKAGHYRRKCDGVVVQRYRCRTCGTRFSRQTFSFTYRWWRPELHLELLGDFVAKCSMRQSARRRGVARATVARRMRVMGAHGRRWHEARLCESAGRMAGVWVFDELETFETDRRVRPVTVPVLIQRSTLFVVDVATAPLPPRGNLGPFHAQRKLRDERVFGKRKSGSREACERAFLKLKPLLAPGQYFDFITDRKSSYRKIIRTHFRERFASHVQEYGRTARNRANPLFPINHTLGMLRDGISRLVRRSWCASKLRERLEDHLWIWVIYRNYIRGITNDDPRVTPAMAAGVCPTQLQAGEVFRWRDFPERRKPKKTASGLGQHP